MSYLPIDTYRPRRTLSSLGARVLRTPFRLALAVLLGVGSLAASAQTTFTMSNNGPITLPSSTYGPVTVTITPVGGFSGSVLLTCTNMPLYASCKFPNLNQIVPVSGGAASITFLVNTSLVDQYEAKTTPRHETIERVAMCSLFAPALCLLFFARRKGVRAAGLTRLMLFVVVLLPLAGLGGCAAVHPLGTPPGTYSLIINGNAGPLNIPTTIVLKVT